MVLPIGILSVTATVIEALAGFKHWLYRKILLLIASNYPHPLAYSVLRLCRISVLLSMCCINNWLSFTSLTTETHLR